jgi:HAD superfamily hydrolase (TIGR01509 family)
MDSRKAKQRISCVIYDCDGVLFDSLEANRRLYNHICASVGRKPLAEEELAYCHTHTVFEALHSLFEDDEAGEKKALEFLKHQVDLKTFVEYLTMEPHLLETLGALRQKKIKTAISTNRTTSMKHVMEKFKLWPYFDMVVTALDVEHPKPHGESVEKIVSALNLKKEEILFVGDSDVDKKTAEASGVSFVAYKTRHLSEDAFIDDHLTLLDFLSNGDLFLRNGPPPLDETDNRT